MRKVEKQNKKAIFKDKALKIENIPLFKMATKKLNFYLIKQVKETLLRTYVQQMIAIIRVSVV